MEVDLQNSLGEGIGKSMYDPNPGPDASESQLPGTSGSSHPDQGKLLDSTVAHQDRQAGVHSDPSK